MSTQLRGSARLACVLLAVALSWTWWGAAADGAVTFFIQREGSPLDTGQQDFLTAAPGAMVQDFEDPALGPDCAELPSFAVGTVQFGATSAFCDGTPFVPFIGYSSEFSVEGKMYSVALAAVTSLTLTPAGLSPVGAVGTWVFDDGGALDSVYLVRVVELDGNVAQVVLANEIPRDAHYHELEGFVGAASTVGVASFTVTAGDPLTLLAQADSFEIDYLTVTVLPQSTDPGDGGGVVDGGGSDGGGSGTGDGSDGASSDDGSGTGDGSDGASGDDGSGDAGDGSGDASDDDGNCPRHHRHHSHQHGRGHSDREGPGQGQSHQEPHHAPPPPPPPPPPPSPRPPHGRH
jgi:hypothetical protein